MNRDTVPENLANVHFLSLKLRAGTRLQMLDMESEAGCEVEFAAALHRKSIFVSLPDAQAGSSGLQIGTHYRVRGFNGTSEFTFPTQILKMEEKPFFHAHMTYPNSVELRVVRDEPRATVSIPILVMPAGKGGGIPCTIRDLNINGALAESAVPLGGVGDAISIEISTHFEGQVVNIKIPALIRHYHHAVGAFKYGLKFGEIAKNDKLILYYMLFTLAESE